MKLFFYLTILLLISIPVAYADQPIINHNVTVMTNSSPGQCTNNWSGSGQEDVSVQSGYGSDSGTAVGIQSCTGCAFDNNTGNCVCRTCYTDY